VPLKDSVLTVVSVPTVLVVLTVLVLQDGPELNAKKTSMNAKPIPQFAKTAELVLTMTVATLALAQITGKVPIAKLMLMNALLQLLTILNCAAMTVNV